ncbi:hypothetical protein E4U42_002982, partial [Claviceps africana]
MAGHGVAWHEQTETETETETDTDTDTETKTRWLASSGTNGPPANDGTTTRSLNKRLFRALALRAPPTDDPFEMGSRGFE